MSPIVFALLIVAAVLFILSFFLPPRQSLWIAAAVAAVLAILLYLFVPALGRG